MLKVIRAFGFCSVTVGLRSNAFLYFFCADFSVCFSNWRLLSYPHQSPEKGGKLGKIWTHSDATERKS